MQGLATLGLAVAGGSLLLALVDAPSTSAAREDRSFAKNHLQILEVSGHACLERPPGWSIALRSGARVSRPAALTASGGRSALALSFSDLELRLDGDARFLVGERGPVAQLHAGRVVVRGEVQASLHLSGAGHTVRGRDFAAWITPAGVQLAVPTGELEILSRGTAPRRIEGPRIVLLGETLETYLLPARLWVEIDEVQRGRRGSRVVGRTAPRAHVRGRLGEAESESWADERGRFTIELSARRGDPDLEVRDVLGRRARAGAPSRASAPRSAPAEDRRPSPAAARERSNGRLEPPREPSADGRRSAAADRAEIPPPAPAAGSGGSRRSGTPGTVRLEVRGPGRPERPDLEKVEIAPGSPGRPSSR